jgi:hypothetical protein
MHSLIYYNFLAIMIDILTFIGLIYLSILFVWTLLYGIFILTEMRKKNG